MTAGCEIYLSDKDTDVKWVTAHHLGLLWCHKNSVFCLLWVEKKWEFHIIGEGSSLIISGNVAVMMLSHLILLSSPMENLAKTVLALLNKITSNKCSDFFSPERFFPVLTLVWDLIVQLWGDLQCECVSKNKGYTFSPQTCEGKSSWRKAFAEHCLGLPWHTSGHAAVTRAALSPSCSSAQTVTPHDCQECVHFPTG